MREAGLRSTPGRVGVLQTLAKAPSPLTHAQLVKELAALGFDQSTVYRNLMDLTQAGLVSRVDLGDHVWRFESHRADDKCAEQHAHFVCVECGEITCLPDLGVDLSRRKRNAPRSVIGDVTEVLLKGHCVNCD